MRELGLLHILLVVAGVNSDNSYLFIGPNTIRPGRDFTIQGSLLEYPTEPVTLTATLRKAGTEVASTQARVSDKNGIVLDIPIPRDLEKGNYDLTLRGRGGVRSFDTKVPLVYKKKGISLYIQTDKAVYKPGQSILFRVFATDPELKIVTDKLHVDLFDPQGTKINQWDSSNFDMISYGGVYPAKQLMADHPELGKWKIVATMRDISEEQTFEVDEYVLPKFEVTLDLPPFGRVKDSQFEGKVKAMYTFGKPVKGVVDLRIRSKRERFVWRNNSRVSTNKEIELHFPIHGEATFQLSKTKLQEVEKFLNGETLIFDANVTESLTQFKLGDKEELKFYNNPVKVEFPKSLSSTFKPSMDYTGVVKVSLVDGSPLDTVAGTLKLTVSETVERRVWYDDREPVPFWQPRRWRPWRPWPPRPVETTRDRNPEYYPIPADGLVTFDIPTSDRVKQLSLKAEYSGSSATKSLKKRHSPSDNFLQITVASNKLWAGDTDDFEIKTTEYAGDINFQVISRGSIVDFGTISARGRSTTLSLPLTQEMAPRSKVMVYYVRTDGEIVADSITVNIHGVFKNKVNLEFNTTQAKPGTQVGLRATAEAGSKVHLLAVDKSVLLLGTGNDISEEKVVEELESFNIKGKSNNNDGPVCDWFCWRYPLPSGGEDVKDVFDGLGVVVLTDALIYEYREPVPKLQLRRRFPSPGIAMMGFAGARAAAPMRRKSSMRFNSPVERVDSPPVAAVPTAKSDLAPVKRVRKLFPETWLWKDVDIPSTGYAELPEIAPDTITSWVATAFAVHEHAGLGLSEAPAQIEISKKFFTSVQLPYSVIRGEQLVIQATVFNYSPEPVYAYVTLTASADFDNIVYSGNIMSTESTNVTVTVSVPPDGAESAQFPILPRKLGRVKINVIARTSTQADALIKELLVEAEGSPREYTLPVMIDLRSGGQFTTTDTVEFPVMTVPGSERVEVTVIGDLMGPSINGLESLLKMPYGCGEQNMLNFAPNIFVVKYLEAINNIDGAIMEKAKNFMTKGYIRELTYRHDDGSFSAFGKRDDSGSIWLTAFVLKSFVQAKPYIFIDDSAVHKMVDWVVKYQNSNGSVWEPGRVIHKNMQGGSTSGEVSLTAYVLIGLLEARSIEGVAIKIEQAKAISQKFLEDQLPSLTDVYDLAIVSYALQLANSPHAATAWTKLDQKSQTSGGLKWWQKEVTPINNNKRPWEKKSGQAINIEITSYALLTLAAKGDTIQGLSVLKWITEQRNSNGGFSSTQDTVLALQALSEIASQIYSSDVDLSIKIVGTGFYDTLTVNSLNSLVLQNRKMPPNVGEITITATGRGFSLAQIEVFYNVNDDDQKKSFHLTTSLPKESMNAYDVKVCASWTESGSSSMAILEIGTPSGFMADPSSVKSPSQEPARVEPGDRKVVLYFDERILQRKSGISAMTVLEFVQEKTIVEILRALYLFTLCMQAAMVQIGRSDTCVTVTMHRIGLVAGLQPVPVRVYDYYEPTKQVTTFYIPEAIRDSSLCGMCGAECNFCENVTI